MFRADLAWAGPLLGVAALALRTYLKGRRTMDGSEIDPRLQLLRDHAWEHRAIILDQILLHECGIERVVQAQIWLLGWEVDVFILAALHDDRGELDA